MSLPGNPGYGAPTDALTQVIRDIEDVRRTVTSMQTQLVARGDLAVVDSDSQIRVGPVGGTAVVMTVQNDGVNDFGSVQFESAFDRTGNPAALTLFDPSGSPDTLRALSPTSPGGAGSFLELDEAVATIEVDSATSTPVASLSIYTGQADFVFGVSGGVSVRPNAVDAPAGVTLYGGSGTDWHATALGTTTTYVPIKASAFTVSSSREVKHDITDLPFDAAEAVKAAPAQAWRYLPDHAADQTQHFGPMAEDLPGELTQVIGGVRSVDLGGLVGTLWAALGQALARIEALENKR